MTRSIGAHTQQSQTEVQAEPAVHISDPLLSKVMQMHGANRDTLKELYKTLIANAPSVRAPGDSGHQRGSVIEHQRRASKELDTVSDNEP